MGEGWLANVGEPNCGLEECGETGGSELMPSLAESNCRCLEGDRPMEGIACGQIALKRSQTRPGELTSSSAKKQTYARHLTESSTERLRCLAANKHSQCRGCMYDQHR